MGKALVLMAFLALSFAATGLSQEDQEFKKWMKQQQEDYRRYMDKHDREFAEFLKKEWRGVELMKGFVPDPAPKPAKAPVAAPPDQKTRVAPPSQEPIALPLPRLPQPARVPEPAAPPVASQDVATCEFRFYDAPVNLGFDRTCTITLDGPLDNKSISSFWERMSHANTEDVREQLVQYRKSFRLNDWGFVELCHAAGMGIEGNDAARATLFTWFILTHEGFDVRVGYTKGRVYLLMTSAARLYNIPFFTFAPGGPRYYALPLDPRIPQALGEINTYEGRFANAKRPADFSVKETPLLGRPFQQKALRFTIHSTPYTVTVAVDPGAVTFFRNYPQSDYAVYFGAAGSPACAASLTGVLKPLVQGKTELEAVNILLRFTQTAFAYKTDAEQFQREKPLFPDETVFYPASDCEDRAVLFAFLVRELLHLEVVGLDYPAHIATAVRFHGTVNGDAITFNGSRYVICDPTYINADAGDCMPQFRSVTPAVISWNNGR